jgi:hypothetical protein
VSFQGSSLFCGDVRITVLSLGVCVIHSQPPFFLPTEHPTPPGPSHAILRAWGIGPGLTHILLLINRLGRFSLVCGGFYGRYPRR